MAPPDAISSACRLMKGARLPGLRMGVRAAHVHTNIKGDFQRDEPEVAPRILPRRFGTPAME